MGWKDFGSERKSDGEARDESTHFLFVYLVSLGLARARAGRDLVGWLWLGLGCKTVRGRVGLPSHLGLLQGRAYLGGL